MLFCMYGGQFLAGACRRRGFGAVGRLPLFAPSPSCTCRMVRQPHSGPRCQQRTQHISCSKPQRATMPHQPGERRIHPYTCMRSVGRSQWAGVTAAWMHLTRPPPGWGCPAGRHSRRSSPLYPPAPAPLAPLPTLQTPAAAPRPLMRRRSHRQSHVPAAGRRAAPGRAWRTAKAVPAAARRRRRSRRRRRAAPAAAPAAGAGCTGAPPPLWQEGRMESHIMLG